MTTTSTATVKTPQSQHLHRIRLRRIGGGVGLLVLLVIGAWLSIAVGAKDLSLSQVWHGLTHDFSTDPRAVSADPAGNETSVIVRTLRLPRTVVALIAGAALGVAGALAQGHTRNPLAEPGLLAINNGAAVGVVVSTTFLTITSPMSYVWFALIGAAVATVAVFGLSSIGRGSANPLSLIIAGWGISVFLYAWTIAISVSNDQTLEAYRKWVVGSVANREWNVVWAVLPIIVVGLVLAFASAPTLNLLSLGDDVARGLGTNLVRTRIVGIAALTLLAGAATAACGPIILLGLIVPHIARAFTGPDYRWLLPYSALLGAVITVVADVIGRVLLERELPVGVVIAIIGAPFFIVLVRYRKLAAQ